MNKQEVINKLRDYIEVLEDDRTRLDHVRISNTPSFAEIYGDSIVADYQKVGDNFDIDIDVSYIGPKGDGR